MAILMNDNHVTLTKSQSVLFILNGKEFMTMKLMNRGEKLIKAHWKQLNLQKQFDVTIRKL